MLQIPLKKYCEMTGLSRQTIYNHIKDGKLKSVKDENGRVYILQDFVNDDSISNEKGISDINEAFGALLVELKKQTKEQIDKIEEVHHRELNITKEYYERILELKDEEIRRLRDKGFFKRLFGG